MGLIHNRNYILLRSAWSISSFGTNMQSFAFSLYVLAVTGSAMQFSLTLCMQILPNILLAPFSGFVADRFNRKMQVILYDCLSAAVVLILFFVYLSSGNLPVAFIYSGVFILSSINTFFNATAGCLMQASVDPADYIKQKSVDTTISSLIAIFVPAAAGMLYSFCGLTIVLLINAVSFFFSAVLESLIRLPDCGMISSSPSAGSFFDSIKDGFQHIRTSPFILSFLVILSALNFILPGVDIGLMTVSQKLMRLSSSAIGFENAAISAGTLASAVLCGFLNKRLEKAGLGPIITGDLLATCAAFLVIGVWLKAFYGILPPAANVSIFVLLNLVIVIANGFLSINLSAQFQRNVPNELMGRIGAFVNASLLVSTPLGEIMSGFLLGQFPYCVTYFTEGILCVLLFVGYFIGRRNVL